MSAARHLNPDQLSMYMSAQQLAAGQLGDAGDPYGVPISKHRVLAQRTKALSDVWADRDLKLTTRQAAFDAEGIKTPLEIDHVPGGPKLGDGHHRLAWALTKPYNAELPVHHNY